MNFGFKFFDLNFFTNLSIHKISLLGANLAAFTVLIFASIIINEEYTNYEKEVSKIEAEFKFSETQKIEALEEIQDEHKKKIMKYIIGVGSLSLFMYFTIFAISRVLSFIIENEINNFLRSFDNAKNDFRKLDKSDFTFKEFKDMAHNANVLLNEIKDRQKKLEVLNLSLEEKVKAKTDKLQNLVKAQDEFVKKSIHEINTPLAVILTNIDLLKFKQIKNKQLRNIESASKIINNIFNDLSYLVKKDRVVYEKQSINISNFLRNRLQFFDEVAQANELDFETNIEEGLFCFINDVHLARIIDNNLSNAIKYSYRNSAIKINLFSTSCDVILEIITNSPPIKDQAKLFEEYYREHSSRGGFGLGLNIVKEICEINKVDILIQTFGEYNSFKYNFLKEKHEHFVA